LKAAVLVCLLSARNGKATGFSRFGYQKGQACLYIPCRTSLEAIPKEIDPSPGKGQELTGRYVDNYNLITIISIWEKLLCLAGKVAG
jgi:hypothetical protein